jgi:hypothetical protein
MIYTYPYFWTSALGDPAALSRYRLWMASYSSRPAVPHALWQYTSTARVRGIVGGVDMSRFVGERDEWRRLADGTRRDRWPTQAPGAPQRVSVSYAGGAATVRWMPGDTGSTDIQSYVVSVAGGATVTVGATTFSARLPGLERGKTYAISVAARNAVGRGTWARLDYTAPLLRATLDVAQPDPVVYGADGFVRARLTRTASGAPLAGRHVSVAQRPVGTEAWQPLPDLVTDDRGRVVLRVTQPVQSLEVQLSFTAPGWVPVSRTVTLPVRSAVTAALDPDLLVPGGYSLHGAVAPAVAGATVRHQELVGGVWQTLATTTTLVDGSYGFSFVPPPGSHRYRVVVDPVDGRWRGLSAELPLSVE